ncbi:hypothetical protein BCA37_05025 [Mycobacterium sp. djl-10]|nr:hypothetical protein BCA37_05025 [Mycobacterium sp. djl-10]
MKVCAVCGETPVLAATNEATERNPVMPASPSRLISATISTIRPSMALRCPESSAISANNTSSRCAGVTPAAAESVALVDMTSLKQRRPTSCVDVGAGGQAAGLRSPHENP